METDELKIITYTYTVVSVVLGIFILFIFLLYKRRQNKHLKNIEQLKKESLRSQLEIQEQTFRNISQEIHDNIGQGLSLAKLNLGVLSQEGNQPSMIGDTKELVGKAINDLRDLSKSINPERVANINLAESISHELEMLEKTKMYSTSLKILGNNYILEKEKKVIFFRIFQEALTNILKHANATTINVQIKYEIDLFSLIITDNGDGFDVQSTTSTGLGTENIRNRSLLIGATTKVFSGLKEGTTVQICMPIPIK